MKIEKAEGVRQRMAGGIQERVLIKNITRELLMINMLKCQGFGVLLSVTYTEMHEMVRWVDEWMEKPRDV